MNEQRLDFSNEQGSLMMDRHPAHDVTDLEYDIYMRYMRPLDDELPAPSWWRRLLLRLQNLLSNRT